MAFFLDWIKARAHEAKAAKESRERAQRLQLQQEHQRLTAYRQRQSNTLSLLRRDQLPNFQWNSAWGPLPFRFVRSESLLHVFRNVGYLEHRTKREIVGRSIGTSVRVMKGVSVRVGQSKGTPVEQDEVVDRGMGTLAVTTKHLYFHGERSFRISFAKIVSIEAMTDAVGITRDRASAQPEYFVVGEWKRRLHTSCSRRCHH